MYRFKDILSQHEKLVLTSEEKKQVTQLKKKENEYHLTERRLVEEKNFKARVDEVFKKEPKDIVYKNIKKFANNTVIKSEGIFS